jgi:ankyrin repeat protein
MLLLLSVGYLAASSAIDLVEAVREGDREAVRFLLSESADVNAAQADGATPLAWAVHRDDVETVKLLINADADVNAANVYGITPLSLACTNRNTVLVDQLLKAGANPNLAQDSGETPLMTCTRTGTEEGARALLLQGADVNVKTVERGQTAVMWAAAGQPAIVRMLVEHGADVHARSKRLGLYTPRIPDAASSNPITGTPVHQGFRETIYHPKFTALMFAAQAGDVESVRALLAAGADVNEGTEETGPALLLAASYGHQEVALLLLGKGADPKAIDGYGMTALHWSLEEGVVGMSGGHTETDPYWVHPNMPELVKALLEKGADPNARIQHDFMPYHIHRWGRGAQQGMGVNLGMRGYDGVGDLIRRKALESVQLAWELGNDVNAIGPDGRRAVHGAALYGLTEVIDFLAEKGADLDAQDMWGQTAMSIALADPDGLIYRHLPNKGQDSTFRRRARKAPETVDQLLSLGATPYVHTGRDLKGF